MSTLIDSFKTAEIKKKLLFTFLIISVLCVLTLIPAPGLERSAAISTAAGWGSIGFLIDVLSMKAFENISITSLGIYPFLVASIVMQIVTLAVPKLRNLAQMGDEGTKIITKLTRIASIISAVVFAALYCVGMRDAVTSSIYYWVAIILCGLSIAVGSAFCGWCVELLNTKGIGDGLTIIIVAGIIRNIPFELLTGFFSAGVYGILSGILFAFFIALLCAGVLFFIILLNMGEKKIRIIFSKRTVGMKQYGMQNQVIPLKVTQAGITPIIYTLTVTLLPSSIIAMVVPGTDAAWANTWKNLPTSPAYIPFFIIFLVFFTYIFAMMQFNPFDMSTQIKQNGGYIQGIKPGKPTSQYLMSLYNNLNSADCAYLIFLCVIPMALSFIPGFSGIAYGGVALALIGGGFIEMKTLLDNALKAEDEKLKQAGKDKRRKNYKK
ncbi:MAG: hypothetical protein IKG30_01230 [Clostridiales bacterium]|nr:hypothetical protein [Clostridiales bacterium]